MKKILTFVINEYDEFLALKGNDEDPYSHNSFWYPITGKKESMDKTLEDSVKRVVKESTSLKVYKTFYLNWTFKYKTMNYECQEYLYFSFVKKNKVVINEESTNSAWLNVDDFVKRINWFYEKNELLTVLKSAINNEIYFEEEKIER